MGHEVVTWAPTFSHLEKRRRSDTEDQFEITKNWRVQLFECGAYQKNIGLGRFRFHRAAVASFERLARTLPRPDVVFCSLPTPAMVKSAIRFAKRNPGTQVVIDVRDLWPDVYMTLLPYPIKALAQFGLRHITTFNRSIMRDADAVTAVSETYLAWAQNSAGDIALGNARVFMIGYQPSEPSDIVPVNPQVTSAISQATAADLSICFVGQLSHFSQLDTDVSAVLEQEQKNNC